MPRTASAWVLPLAIAWVWQCAHAVQAGGAVPLEGAIRVVLGTPLEGGGGGTLVVAKEVEE